MRRFLLFCIVFLTALVIVFLLSRKEPAKPGQVRYSIASKVLFAALAVMCIVIVVLERFGVTYARFWFSMPVMLLMSAVSMVMVILLSRYRLDHDVNGVSYRSLLGIKRSVTWQGLQKIRHGTIDRTNLIVQTEQGKLEISDLLVTGVPGFLRAAQEYAPQCEIAADIRSMYEL